ncbi:MAG TPA: hypothetical protein VNI34_06590 [Candidatus Nitrosotalea sp.]|nr:hypothetical protein [Candidatus Nitrosotalea sp.]
MSANPDGWVLLDDEDTLRRAFAAYFRYSDNAYPIQPANDSYHAEFQGKEYVVLQNANGVLAVYRVRNDGKLKRLRRWPGAL